MSEHNQVPGLLGKLGKLTSIRDTELLEQSLLKTLGGQLGVLDTALYRTEGDTNVIRVIHHHRSKEISTDGVDRFVERVEIVSKLGDARPEIRNLIDSVQLLGKPCTFRVGDEMLIGYPMFANNTILGYFVFQRDREVLPTEDTIIRGVLEVFSNYHTLLDASQRDRLTGLHNRQALENSFERIWAAMVPTSENIGPDDRRHTHASTYWVGIIDIDNFKVINDTYGHMVGDEILLLTARLMAAGLRSGDLLYRYGGEEFVAIVTAESEDVASHIFDRLRLAIESQIFPRVGRLTISIGYSQIGSNLLPTEVLSRADRSLYQAKQDGRNRIYGYDQLIRAGVFKEVEYDEPVFF